MMLTTLPARFSATVNNYSAPPRGDIKRALVIHGVFGNDSGELRSRILGAIGSRAFA